MIMSVCVVMHFLVVAVRMPLIPVSHDPVKMELNVVQSWIMATNALVPEILMYAMLRKHVQQNYVALSCQTLICLNILIHAHRAEIVKMILTCVVQTLVLMVELAVTLPIHLSAHVPQDSMAQSVNSRSTLM